MKDTLTLAGAKELCAKITRYWETEGRNKIYYQPMVRIEPPMTNIKKGGVGYVVRSDMINGLPRRKQFNA